MTIRRILFWLTSGVFVLAATGAAWWWFAAAREQLQWDLSAAAESGRFDQVRHLIEHRGARADRWPTRGGYLHGMSAINSAAGAGHTQIVAYLLDHGADIETQESDIRSPLARAIGRKDVATARMLLERGANANATGQRLKAMNLEAEMRALLKKHGAVDQTLFREVPPMHLLCSSRMVDDHSIGAFATRSAADIRQFAEAAGAKITGPLQLIYRGRNPRRAHLAADPRQAPTYQLEVAIPVLEFTDTAPPGFYYRTATAFKCIAAATAGNRKTIGSAWWIVENAVFGAGLGPTYETREVYREWRGFGAQGNVLELQCGLYSATRNAAGELLYDYGTRDYLREAYR